jgi:phosphoenolpyruvate carboxykinase (ATP)
LPNDEFLVREPSSESKIAWRKINRPLDPDKFDALKHRLCAYLQGKDIFIENCYQGANAHYRVPIRIISEREVVVALSSVHNDASDSRASAPRPESRGHSPL